MSYSNATLVSDWHKSREAEPKDYDFTALPDGKKSLHKSTYRHFGTSDNTCWSTTTGEQFSQHLLKKRLEAVGTRRSMMRADLLDSVVLDRETNHPKAGHNAVLPRHQLGHNRMALGLDAEYCRSRPKLYAPMSNVLNLNCFHGYMASDLKTTYVQDYLPPYTPDKQETRVTHDEPEESGKFRKRISQFTDAADYRRWGRNTWQDEREERTPVVFKPTNPIGL